MKIDHEEGLLSFDLITTPFTNNMADWDHSLLTLHPKRPYKGSLLYCLYDLVSNQYSLVMPLKGTVTSFEIISVAIYSCQKIRSHPPTPTQRDNASFSVALAADFYHFLWSVA